MLKIEQKDTGTSSRQKHLPGNTAFSRPLGKTTSPHQYRARSVFPLFLFPSGREDSNHIILLINSVFPSSLLHRGSFWELPIDCIAKTGGKITSPLKGEWK
jgi:hypothetical protein